MSLFSVWWGQAQEGNADHSTWGYSAVLAPDMPYSWMVRLFWRRKTLNSTGMGFELRLMPEMQQQKTSAVPLNLWKLPNALKLFMHVRVLSECNPNCFRLAETGSFSSFTVCFMKIALPCIRAASSSLLHRDAKQKCSLFVNWSYWLMVSLCSHNFFGVEKEYYSN